MRDLIILMTLKMLVIVTFLPVAQHIKADPLLETRQGIVSMRLSRDRFEEDSRTF